MSRPVDRGAVFAGWVGLGMAVVIGVSFLLVIPIEPVVWLLSPFAGLLIGYYANQRSERGAGPWARIMANGLYAGLVTALGVAALLLIVKVVFFYADDGFRPPAAGGSIACTTGRDCVYRRYVEERGKQLDEAGIRDAGTFEAYYWGQQLSTAGTIVVVTVAGGLVGALLFGISRPRGPARASASRGAG